MKKEQIKSSLKAAFLKLKIKYQIKNLVMFLVYLCSIITTLFWIASFIFPISENRLFMFMVSFFLWITVIFANFAESMAESRGKAGAEFLKKSKKETIAKVLKEPKLESEYQEVNSSDLKKGDIVLVQANEQIPLDGEVIVGVASVDESAITGESAPVIREARRR